MFTSSWQTFLPVPMPELGGSFCSEEKPSDEVVSAQLPNWKRSKRRGELNTCPANKQSDLFTIAYIRPLSFNCTGFAAVIHGRGILPSPARRRPLCWLAKYSQRHQGESLFIIADVQEAGKAYSLVLTLSTILAAVSLFPSTLLAPATLIFAAALFLVNIAGPGMLWYGWRWKTRRGGGWDVAVVRVRKAR